MAEETITIFKVGTEQAVKSIADLRNNIKALKEGFEDAQGNMHKGLNDLEIGTQEYKDTLDLLKVNQNALKDAMYATSSEIKDLAKAATGANIEFNKQNELITDGSISYNELVHAMANLKEEFRSTTDVVRRGQIGDKIKSINDELKKMDASQGNFQRNVGNYANSIKDAFEDMSKNVDAFRKGMGGLTGGLNGFKDGLEGISKSPAIATFGILVSVAIKLADELKDNETAMAGLKKAMAALQPVMDFLSGIIEKLATYLADVIVKVTEFVTSNGLIQKVINGVMGVGNAILQFVIAPFKGVVAAIKVFKEQGVKGLGDAAKAFAQEMKSGVSFKENFQTGQVFANTIIAGAKSRKKEVNDAGKEMGKDLTEGLLSEMDKLTKRIEDKRKKMDDSFAKGESKFLEDLNKEIDKEIEDDWKETLSDLSDDTETYLSDEVNKYKEEFEELKKIQEAKKALLQGVADATSSILGSIADMYEADSEASEKNAKKVKNLRIAAATIDTISGAIGAYMSAVKSLPAPYGAIAGAVQAAAVTAAGFAEIAKIKSTNVSGNSSSSSSSAPALVSSPSLTTEVSNVRSVTSASEEDRLNQMASAQRVYILSSDIEASQRQIKTQVAESSF